MTKEDEKNQIESVAAIIDSILSHFYSGSLRVAANGFPVLSLDCASMSLDVDASGVKESGFKLSEILGHWGGIAGMLKDSEAIANKLARDGWTLTLYDSGARALTMGRKVSRLTGHISVNPLRLRRLLSMVF